MAQFDFADPDMANSRRATTIVPAQALFFMNSPMSVDVARKITSREEFRQAHDDAGRVRAIYQVLFQRAPRGEEIRLAGQFIAAEQGSMQTPPSLADSRAKQRFAQKPNPAAANKRNGDARKAVQNQGDYVERKPLTPWELYTQALLFTNELAYVN
jgi:hypothetical protein